MSRITHHNSALDSREDNRSSSTDILLSLTRIHDHEVRGSEEVVLGRKSKMWLVLKFARCVKLLTQPHCHQTDFCVPREAQAEERTTSIELGLEA